MNDASDSAPAMTPDSATPPPLPTSINVSTEAPQMPPPLPAMPAAAAHTANVGETVTITSGKKDRKLLYYIGGGALICAVTAAFVALGLFMFCDSAQHPCTATEQTEKALTETASAAKAKKRTEKPEMSLSEIVGQLLKYTKLGEAIVGIPTDSAGVHIPNNYHTYTRGEDFLTHVERCKDGLETCGDYAFIPQVMYYAYSANDTLPVDKYVRSLIAMGADVNRSAEIGIYKTSRSSLSGELLVRRETKEYTPLVCAILHNDKEMVRLLLEKGANPNKADGDGDLPLHLCEDLEICKMLLDAGADANAVDKQGYTAMGWAASRERLDIVQALQQAGGHARPADGVLLFTPLKNNKTDILEALLAEGADPNAKDDWNCSLLQRAAANGDANAAHALLAAGAKLDGEKENQTRTALWDAVNLNQLDMVKVLVAAGSCVSTHIVNKAFAEKNDEVIDVLLSAYKQLKLSGERDDQEALAHVCRRGNLFFVQALLKAGVKPVSETHDLMYEAVEGGNALIVKLLIDAGADMSRGDSLLLSAGKNGRLDLVELLLENGVPKLNQVDCLALKNASSKGNRDVVEALLAAGVAADGLGRQGLDTALQIACQLSEEEIVKLLLDAGADVNLNENPRSMSALAYACNHGRVKIVKMLIAAGAEIDYNGACELQAACDGEAKMSFLGDKLSSDCDEQGRLEVVKLLLSSGVKVDGMNALSGGRTALIYAAIFGRTEIVQVLLAAGANVNASDYDYMSALQWACRQGHQDCVRVLLEAKAKSNSRAVFDYSREIELAKEAGHEEIVRMLMAAENGRIPVDASASPSASEVPAADSSASTDASEVTSFLSSVNAYSDSGSNALYKKRLNMLLPMIADGSPVDVTTVETKGNTALHYASGLGHLELVRWLLQHGADPNAVTNKGATPLKCSGSKAVSELLKQYGAR